MAETEQEKLVEQVKQLPRIPRPKSSKPAAAKGVKADRAAAIKRGENARAAAIKRGEDARKKAREKK